MPIAINISPEDWKLKVYFKSSIIMVLLVCSIELKAQQMSINTDGSLPDSSAMLDVSSSSKGLLIPRMTKAQRDAIANPANGLMIIQTDTNHGVWMYDNNSSGWEKVITSSDTTNFSTDTLTENIYSAAIENNGTASVLSQNLPFISSVNRYALGSVEVNFVSGFFTQPPAVLANIITQVDHVINVSNVTVSKCTVRVYDVYSTGGGNFVDDNFYITVFRQGSDYKHLAINGAASPFSSMQSISEVLIEGNDAMSESIFNLETIESDSASIDKLNINDAFIFPNSDGTNGQIMQTDGSGNLTWVTPSSSSDGDGIYDGSGSLAGNTIVTQGANTLDFTTTATDGFSVDGTTFSVDGANNRVGIGKNNPTKTLDVNGEALINGHTIGRGNSNVTTNLALGSGALNAATGSSYSNIAVGTSALGSITSGHQNTAIGRQALSTTTIGNDNTAVGYDALGDMGGVSQNTAVGFLSQRFTTTGGFNTSMGAYAMNGNLTGAYNVSIGAGALGANVSGDSNTAVGAGSGVGSGNLVNATALGAFAIVNTSNSLVLGNEANVGIGTSSPTQKLDVVGTAEIDSLRINNSFAFPSMDGTNGQVLQTNGSGNVTWETPTATLAGGSATKLARWTNASALDTSLITDNGLTVGVNTAPAATDLFRSTTNDASIFRALSGIHSLSSSDITYGVYGSSSSSDNNNAAGVYGTASNGAVAVYGQNGSSLSGTVAVKGWNAAGGSNQNFGVKGQTSSTHASSAGIYGFAFHGGNAILAESNARVIEAESYGTRTTSFNAIELNNFATSSTAGISKTGLNIQSTGSWSGASAQNIGLNVNVGGGTTNYAALFNGGKVGIGTNTPETDLHMYNATSAAYLRMNGSGDAFNFSGFDLRSDEATDKAWSFYHRKIGAEINNLAIEEFDGSNYYQRLVIKPGGNVGIGTSSPTNRLHISSPLVDAMIRLNQETATYTSEIVFADQGTAKYTFGSSYDSHAWGEGMFFFNIDRSIVDLFIDGDNGNVGIGTTNPDAKLTIGTPGTTWTDYGITSDSRIGATNGSGNQEAAVLESRSGLAQFYGFNYSTNTPMDVRVGVETAKVGIGTDSPQDNLHVNGGFKVSSGTDYDFDIDFGGIAGGSTIWRFRVRDQVVSSNVMTLNKWGEVGIGTDDPNEALHVIGNIEASGSVFASSSTLTSDRRFKTDLVLLTNTLDKLDSVNAFYHNWDTVNFPDKDFQDKTAIGVMAQDLIKVYPELVNVDKDGYYSVEYSKLTAVLLMAIKEQQTEIETLNSKYDDLLTRIQNLER